MRVIFFDIDGTLIRSGGAGKAAMHRAMVDEFAIHEIRDEINFSGNTDTAICHGLLELHGVEPSMENIERMIATYLGHLSEQLPQHPAHVLPGVEELIDQLVGQDRHALGLLTGNVREGAEIKLKHFGLWDYFSFGGFGNAIFDRDDVARSALREAEEHFGTLDRSDIWVIGDTPMDVKCARAIGAKAVAVATGWHTWEQLAACEPDVLLSDFRERLMFD